ncbi:XrtA/PEP-CTERM system amidotransferase [Novosphingobium sp. BW1]|uniref:XrtA/PEP-CTERM system amidotransferase n=1 Tax=Novosphingobium sp. BW1 TaxID=2592621 RepID=UPI0011DEF6FB|nr:XrtA/PEP-CTERM system amidotransferase [Novosphingobium sp. BW1]TYC90696.1 amidotransferase 1, exosortase A system-associated [Novosphingobium sp. BW1]
MCGIVGIYHLDTPKPVDPSRVAAMCDALAHRGPDGEGVWTAPGVGLGHRRLSIIDLAGSSQPMASSDGRAVLVFNGEIYNFRELRRELAAGGVHFRTDGDSEVILAAWQRWGKDCLQHLQGMFAFAIYDLEARSLFLARDRLGVKPLFYSTLSDGSVIFGSELKALLAHPLLRREPDPLAVEDYMTWGYVPDHRAILKHVHKLAAGHFLLLRHGKPLPEPSEWWDVSFAGRRSGRRAALEDELHTLLQEAVRSRMMADVPLGAFLSGGVDSSSVVAFMAKASAQPVRTCSIGFDVAGLDETAYAQKIAQRFGTSHVTRRVSPDDFEAVEALADMFDEPFADASALPTWRVCQLAREHVTVALSGDGADEALAGYRRHVFQRAEDRVRSTLPASMRAAVFGRLGALYPKADWAPRPLRAKSTLLALAGDSAQGYARALAYATPEVREALYSPEFQRLRGDYRAEQPLEALMRKAPARSGLDRAQYADLKFWLPGDILTKIDRTSMAVGLEAREPLLDHRLVEFAACLPESFRVRGRQGKWLMKHAMQRHLPEDILYRPKQGFVTPIAQWFRGPLQEAAREIAHGKGLAAIGWFDQRYLGHLVEEHVSGRSDHARLLWQLLMLERSFTTLGLV